MQQQRVPCRLIALVLLWAMLSPVFADPSAAFPPTPIPKAPANWDNFDRVDPATFNPAGGTIPTKRLRLTLNDVYPGNPNVPQWMCYQMDYGLNGAISFSRKGLHETGALLPDSELTAEARLARWAPSFFDLEGLRFWTEDDVDALVVALHKYDEWANIAVTHQTESAVKDISRSSRYLFTFIVADHQPRLRITKLMSSKYLINSADVSYYSDGTETHDFIPNEVQLFEFFLSRISDLQIKMRAAEKADPFH